jgi:predicted transcriptional regulator of viral defense system
MTTHLDSTPAANRPDYAALYLIAEGQRGYFTTHQARQTGISDRLLTHWVKIGRFHRVAHGIYRMRDFPATPREELMIPLLWAGPDSALSHETAIELYGLADVLPTTTHLTVPASFRPRAHAGVTLHREPLSPDEIALRDDLRVTTVERTLVDSFRWGTDRDQLLLAARQAVERGLVNAHRLRQILDEAEIAHHFDPALTSEATG